MLASPSKNPVVELATTGRKTGQQRVSIVRSPINDESRVVLVASRSGDDRNPDWFFNLQANPDVELTMPGGHPRPYRARVASAEEKAELWPEIISVFKWYDNMQKRTHRDIPVVICEPRP